MTEKDSSLVVVGAGVMGLALAGEVAELYESVTVLEKNRYTFRESSYAAGGMISPFMEAEFQEEDVLALNRRSLNYYDTFAEKVEAESGVSLDLMSRGSLYVAIDDAQQTELRRLYDFQKKLGLPINRLTAKQVKENYPLVSDRVRGGVYAPGEKHVNNRQLGLALYRRCINRDVQVLTKEPVMGIDYSGGQERITKLVTPDLSLTPDDVILTAGSWSGRIPGLKPADRLPVRPVKGEAVSVRMTKDFSPKTVVHSPDFYGVPHGSERFLIGATMCEDGFDSGVRTGSIMELLDAAGRVLPDVRNRELLETWSGFRPAARDSRPVIGPSQVTENLYFATGHYRNGILQVPVTVRALRSVLRTGESPNYLSNFLPARFQEESNQRPETSVPNREVSSC